MIRPSKQAAAGAPMSKSVEHFLLRLLTPAMLLFLFAHVVSAALGINAPGDQPGAAPSAHYFQNGSGAGKATRPAKVRLSRTCGSQALMTVKAGFWDAAVAYVAAVLPEESSLNQPTMLPCRSEPLEVFAHLRTHNPRDPPRQGA